MVLTVAYWVLDTLKCFDTRKKILETLSFVYQNISACLKLNRPRLAIVYCYIYILHNFT